MIVRLNPASVDSISDSRSRLVHVYIHFTWQCLVLDAIKQREDLHYLPLFSPSVICSGSNIPSCPACQQQVITNRVHHEIPLDLSSHISISGGTSRLVFEYL